MNRTAPDMSSSAANPSVRLVGVLHRLASGLAFVSFALVVLTLFVPLDSTASAQRRNNWYRPPWLAARRRVTSPRESTSMPPSGAMRALRVGTGTSFMVV